MVKLLAEVKAGAPAVAVASLEDSEVVFNV